MYSIAVKGDIQKTCNLFAYNATQAFDFDPLLDMLRVYYNENVNMFIYNYTLYAITFFKYGDF